MQVFGFKITLCILTCHFIFQGSCMLILIGMVLKIPPATIKGDGGQRPSICNGAIHLKANKDQASKYSTQSKSNRFMRKYNRKK